MIKRNNAIKSKKFSSQVKRVLRLIVTHTAFKPCGILPTPTSSSKLDIRLLILINTCIKNIRRRIANAPIVNANNHFDPFKSRLSSAHSLCF